MGKKAVLAGWLLCEQESRSSGAIPFERAAAEVERCVPAAGGEGSPQKFYMLWEVIRQAGRAESGETSTPIVGGA